MAKRKVTRKKIVRKNIADGIVHIAASFNNTMVTVTDNAGNAIAWSSAGNLGFKGSKKSTPFAAQAAVEDAMNKAMEHGIKNVGIKIQGPGSGRDTAVKSAGNLGFKGSKKSTPFAAQAAVEDAMAKAMEHGIKNVGIKIQGPGSGRDTAVKAVGAMDGVRITWLKDVTPLPHNGCRPPKRRRV